VAGRRGIWANLTTISAVSGYGACTQGSLSITVNNNNRISSSGFIYDAAGNLKHQGACPGTTYTGVYPERSRRDAENRLTSTAGVTYTYDGDGKRAMKSNGTLYWHGGGSDTLMETDLAGNLLDEYIYFNGQRIARRSQTSQTNSSVYYFFSDHLGSSRIVTDSTGAVKEDSDFYPFGGERVVVDQLNNNYKFTGQERDWESGLDYFIARHYAFTLGRFLQPDEFTGGPVDVFSSNDPLPPGPLPYADITNAQSLIKYTYTYNNSLRYTDPNGHEHKGLFGLVRDWLDVIEVEVSAGIQLGGKLKLGTFEGKREVTVVGAEAKSGLGGGNPDLKINASGEISVDSGPVKGSVRAGSEVSATTGGNAYAEASGTVGGTTGGVRVDKEGVEPVVSTEKGKDVVIGGAVKGPLGVGLTINFSQAARAAERTAESAKALVQAVAHKLTPALPPTGVPGTVQPPRPRQD